jgi:hypothetical protein
VRLCTVVDEAHGDGYLESLSLRHVPSGASTIVETACGPVGAT